MLCWAPLVIAFPVAEMSWPMPAVVLQALDRAVAPDSRRRPRTKIARLLRIGNFLRLRLVGGNDFQLRIVIIIEMLAAAR